MGYSSENMYAAFQEAGMVFKTGYGYIGRLVQVEDWDEDTGLPTLYSGFITVNGRKIWNCWHDDGSCGEPNYNIVQFFPDLLLEGE